MKTKLHLIAPFTIAVLAGSFVVTEYARAAVSNVYWTDRDNATLSVTAIGGGTTQLASGFSRLQDVDLDLNTNTLYFTDWGPVGPPGGQGTINRIQTNGSGLSTVLNTGDAVHQVELDPANSRLYFTRAVSYDNREISRVDYSGANYTVLQQGTNTNPWGWFQSALALDSANGLLYWGDIGIISNPPDGSVNVMNINGSSPTQLTPHVNGRGRAFAMDAASQTIFLTAHDPVTPSANGEIFAYDIVNNTETTIVPNNPTSGYWDIQIDPYSQRIWWTAYSLGQVLSSKFDGSDIQVELTGLSNPYGLALEFVPEPSSFVLVAIGLSATVALGRRRRRKHAL